ILSGFSQGAAMTLDVGLHLPLAGLVALSGYLHPVTESTTSAISPILLVHGRQDSVVPLSAAQKARDSLLAMGAKVQYQEFDMGHEIRPEVIALIRNFIVAQQKVS
nr:alpha/beta hydrolase [Tatlockia sp.]